MVLHCIPRVVRSKTVRARTGSLEKLNCVEPEHTCSTIIYCLRILSSNHIHCHNNPTILPLQSYTLPLQPYSYLELDASIRGRPQYQKEIIQYLVAYAKLLDLLNLPNLVALLKNLTKFFWNWVSPQGQEYIWIMDGRLEQFRSLSQLLKTTYEQLPW